MRAIKKYLTSNLTRQIVFLNLAGLFALFLGFLYFNQFRESLIDAKMQSLLTQGEIIAGAVAASASVETDGITIKPERLLEMKTGELYGWSDDEPLSLSFSINPERIAPILRYLILPTRTRARIYDLEASLILDSRLLDVQGDVSRFILPPPNVQQVSETETSMLETLWKNLKNLFYTPSSLPEEDYQLNEQQRSAEVAEALKGMSKSVVRLNAAGETIVSVAVPVRRMRMIKGVLLLSTQGGDIDQIITKERWALLEVFLISALIMMILSLFLAGTLAGPIKKLSAAAERVRYGIKVRHNIPDFSNRHDEIGQLSGALRDMTNTLYNRIEAIERFAADVAHELKNPLTSLRSAVETLPLAKTETSKNRLVEVIQHDVKRLDRLITDIADASRLDAELARSDEKSFDITEILHSLVKAANTTSEGGKIPVEFECDPYFAKNHTAMVLGHASRLGQVVMNLIDNARSFSPKGGHVKLTLKQVITDVLGDNKDHEALQVCVEDQGCGIPNHALDRIFERFYTDRPEQNFGQHSGLGLAISRQIIEAHGGKIWAENIYPQTTKSIQEGKPIGARVIFELPLYDENIKD